MAAHAKFTGKAQLKVGHNTPVLCFWVLVACLYVGWLAVLGGSTGVTRLDGSLGMFLGLYICSNPAANMLDILLFMSADVRERIIHNRPGQLWLALNGLTMLAGWVVIFSGALRFVQ